ncbi:MAG TPA: 3-ketoacyl-CoA thiolase, partial [Kiritimatiellia bacterium]
MKALRKPVYVAAGYNTTFMGPGRKEFDPAKPMRTFESYLKEAADGALAQVKNPALDEGVICNFMAPRYL